MRGISLICMALLYFCCLSNTYASEKILADFVLVKKSDRLMFLMSGRKVIKSYKVSLGRNPVGHKVKQGDFRTPEGLYTIDYRNPQSQFNFSLHINYPNEQDKRLARERGVDPGGEIFIHGLPNGKNYPDLFDGVDWTRGCIGVDNIEIMEIAKLVPNGTPIQIDP